MTEQEQFEQEAADYAFMDDTAETMNPAAATLADSRAGITMSHHSQVPPATSASPTASMADLIISAAAGTAAANLAVDAYDARLIRQARELAEAVTTEDKRAWLIANGRPEAADVDYSMVTALVIGSMQHVLSSLANGYERELHRNA